MTDTDSNAGSQGGGQGQQNLKVNVPDDLRKGAYSNAVSVNVNSNEVVVDFGYLLPNTTDPEIEVVSRINMNQKTAESFLSVLGGAIEDFKAKAAAQASSGVAVAPAHDPHTPGPGAHVPPPAPVPHAGQAAPAPAPHPGPADGSAPTHPMPAPPMPPLPENS